MPVSSGPSSHLRAFPVFVHTRSKSAIGPGKLACIGVTGYIRNPKEVAEILKFV